MNRKKIAYLLIIISIILLIFLLIQNKTESFTNIKKPEDHEHEYLMPIFRLLYSDTINFINKDDSADLIIAQNSIPKNGKPYIFLNGEPQLRQNKLYQEAVKDSNCVACIVTSLDFDDMKKTFYLPMILDRGHTYFTSSPFIRKYKNSEQRKYLAAYIARHSPQHRDEFFKELSGLDTTVHGLGKANHNKDSNLAERNEWWETVHAYKDYTFGFAMENTYEKGYLTEKIMNVYLGGAIPLYWGSPIVKEIFHPDSFIYLNDYPTLKDAAKDIIEISKNPERLKIMREAPIFLNNSKYESYYNVPPPDWVREIANKIKSNILNI